MTSFDPSAPGVLLARPDLAWLDTRALAWEAHPRRAGVLRRRLVDDGRVAIDWVPPGAAAWAEGRLGAGEILLVLDGEVAAAPARGTPPRLGRGWALAWDAGSDREPAAVGPTGTTLLVIRDGSAPDPAGPAFPPAPADPRLLDTRAMPWEAAGRYGGVRVLARDGDGAPLLTLQHVRGDLDLPGTPPLHSHVHDQHDFVIWGEFPMAELDPATGRPQEILMQAGHFVHRCAGEVHGLVPGGTSPTGCVTLQWYSDPAGCLAAGPGATTEWTPPLPAG